MASSQRLGLGAKLILVSTLLTLVAVAASFLALGLEIRNQTQRLLARAIARQQGLISQVQEQQLAQLLRTSTLLTDSPTLRAALEVYRSEVDAGTQPQADVLATIESEARKIAGIVGGDLLVITDYRGRVLASTADAEAQLRASEKPSLRAVVQRALVQDRAAGEHNLAVLELGGVPYQIGAVPVTLQGYVIGALALGQRLDQAWIDELRATFDCEVVVTDDERILVSSLPGLGSQAAAALAALRSSGEPQAASRVLRLGGVEYMAAPTPLGADAEERPVRLLLLHSIGDALAESNRSLATAALLIGLTAVVLGGLASGLVARSLLRPLARFVEFMRTVASSGDPARRFESEGGASYEIRTLIEAYTQLSDSLQEHQRKLLDKAQQELEQLERLKETEKLAGLGRLLSGAAHEINNPLTGVVGNIEMLLSDPQVGSHARARLETIRSEGQRIVALVRNLLRIAYRDAGDHSVVDLNQVLRDTARLRQHDFKTAGIELRLDCTEQPLPVMGSALELQQVFLNVVNNAYDVLEGRPGSTLTLETRLEAGRAVARLADNGPGLASAEQVFEPFYTTKPVGKGTGLGLSISRAIIDRHRGTITAENVAGAGARFTVALPWAEQAALAVATPRPHPVESTPQRRSSDLLRASVLVVDDEPCVLELQMALLDAAGASAVSAASGAEAIDRLAGREFDLIVSDLRMPGGISGKELYAWVERNRPAALSGFVFVTGDTIAEAEFLDAVRASCILKPFTMEEYLTSLREVLHAHKHAA